MFYGYELGNASWENCRAMLPDIAREGTRFVEPTLLSEGDGWRWNELAERVQETAGQGLTVISVATSLAEAGKLTPERLAQMAAAGIREIKVPDGGDPAVEKAELSALADKLSAAGLCLCVRADAAQAKRILASSRLQAVSVALIASEGAEVLLREDGERIVSVSYAGDEPDFRIFCAARRAEIPQFGSLKAIKTFFRYQSMRAEKSSCLEIYDVETNERKVVARFDKCIEAPCFLPDGDTVFYSADQKLYVYSISRGREILLDTGICQGCSNDHVLSWDGTMAAFSDMSVDEKGFHSHVYGMPLNFDMESGTSPRLAMQRMTDGEVDWLHGWSRDNRELVYCAFRPADEPGSGINGRNPDGSPDNRCVDLYAAEIPDQILENIRGLSGDTKITAAPVTERRLTDGRGYSDGPEYDPDGHTVWFNSTRCGLMQVFTVQRDGTGLKRLFESDRNEWFPHVSPDGKKVCYVSYSAQALLPSEHLPGLNVELWLMDADGSNRRKLLETYGGQGAINVNSWSPDSRYIAFVTYLEE